MPRDLVGPGRRGDWLSTRWSWHFRWQGIGPMPAHEAARLHAIIGHAEGLGHQLRFWGTPALPGARENVWAALLTAGVDRISSDDLRALERFLRARGRCAQSRSNV